MLGDTIDGGVFSDTRPIETDRNDSTKPASGGGSPRILLGAVRLESVTMMSAVPLRTWQQRKRHHDDEVRKGADDEQADDDPPLVDCLDHGLALLDNVRIPATLLAAAALATLSAVLDQIDKFDWDILEFFNVMALGTSVAFEFTSVFVSTSTSVRMMGGGYDPMARNAVEMLRREHEFAYLNVCAASNKILVSRMPCA